MGKRGPSKKPAATKKRERTFRKDRDAGVEVPTGVPATPEIRPDALREWNRLVAELPKRDLLSKADVLELYCRAYGEYCEADAIVNDFGSDVRDRQGICRIHPAATIREQVWKRALLVLCDS